MSTTLTLEEMVDVLAMHVGLIAQAIIYQQTGPPTAPAEHHTVIDEDEEMGDFEEEEEEERYVASGVAKSGKACLPKYVPPQLFDGTWTIPSHVLVLWYCIFQNDTQNFVQPNLRLCLPSCILKEEKHNFGEIKLLMKSSQVINPLRTFVIS
jgi:hypothetical protein